MIRLIAMGNRLMGDDGVALRVTEQLEEQLRQLGVSVWAIETDPYSCLDEIREEDIILLLDAMEGLQDYTTPGDLLAIPLHEAIENSILIGFSHEISLLTLLRVFGYQNTGYFLGIIIVDRAVKVPAFGLSPAIEAALPQLCQSVLKFVTSLARTEYNITINS